MRSIIFLGVSTRQEYIMTTLGGEGWRGCGEFTVVGGKGETDGVWLRG